VRVFGAKEGELEKGRSGGAVKQLQQLRTTRSRQIELRVIRSVK
jgi:hypothetical protein